MAFTIKQIATINLERPNVSLDLDKLDNVFTEYYFSSFIYDDLRALVLSAESDNVNSNRILSLLHNIPETSTLQFDFDTGRVALSTTKPGVTEAYHQIFKLVRGAINTNESLIPLSNILQAISFLCAITDEGVIPTTLQPFELRYENTSSELITTVMSKLLTKDVIKDVFVLAKKRMDGLALELADFLKVRQIARILSFIWQRPIFRIGSNISGTQLMRVPSFLLDTSLISHNSVIMRSLNDRYRTIKYLFLILTTIIMPFNI